MKSSLSHFGSWSRKMELVRLWKKSNVNQSKLRIKIRLYVGPMCCLKEEMNDEFMNSNVLMAQQVVFKTWHRCKCRNQTRNRLTSTSGNRPSGHVFVHTHHPSARLDTPAFRRRFIQSDRQVIDWKMDSDEERAWAQSGPSSDIGANWRNNDDVPKSG